MDLRVLDYFLMVAREENFTRAASQLHITQPTLSRQIVALEEELGTKLFIRDKHSVYLTDEGLLFRRRAQEILSLSERAKQELIQEEENLSGEIVIGCCECMAMDELTVKIAVFREKHPNVTFVLHSSYNEDVQMWLEQGRLDLGLLMEPVDITKYEYIRMKTKEQWGVYVKEGTKFSDYECIKPGELVGTPVITVMGAQVHNELVTWSGDYAKGMGNWIRYNLLYNAASACRMSGSPIVGLKMDCTYRELKFLPLEPKLELSTVLAWKERQINSKAVDRFISFIKNS